MTELKPAWTSFLARRVANWSRLLAELEALPMVATIPQSPTVLEEAIKIVVPYCQMNWSNLNASMFPTADLSQVNLTTTGLSGHWQMIRDRQHSVVENAIRGYTGKGSLHIVDSGMEAVIPKGVMESLGLWAYQGDEVAAIVDQINPLVDCGVTSGYTYKRLSLATKKIIHGKEVNLLDDNQWFQSWLYSRLQDYLGIGLYFQPFMQPGEVAPIRNMLAGLSTQNWQHFFETKLRDRDDWRKMYTPVPTRSRIDSGLQRTLEESSNIKDATNARAAFDAFPFIGRRPSNAKASRGWGIELEVIDAGNVHEPDSKNFRNPGKLLTAKQVDAAPGWKKVRDGSLTNLIGDGLWYDPWEFVSPILKTTFDVGLEYLCSQIDKTFNYHKAGVHVHVSASTLPKSRGDKPETMDTLHVGRVLELYTMISPLLTPILERKTMKFCEPYDLEEWTTGWRGQDYPAKYAKLSPKDPRYNIRGHGGHPTDAAENVRLRMALYAKPQGPDPLHPNQPAHDNTHRYREVNLESLAKYGTIEFRAMGAVYRYDHLVKWAWLCREIVNFAASDMSLAPFRSMRTLDEVLDFIRATAVETLSVAKRDLPLMKEVA